jgi:hypothetical protein
MRNRFTYIFRLAISQLSCKPNSSHIITITINKIKMIDKEMLNNVSAHQRQLDLETAKFAASVGLTLEDYIATMEELHQERLKEEQDFMNKNIDKMARVYSEDPDEYRVPGIARKIYASRYNKP